MARDYQRQRVYDAEHFLQRCLKTAESTFSIGNSLITVPPELRFGSVEAAKKYVTRVCLHEGVPVPRLRERKTAHRAHHERRNGTGVLAFRGLDDHGWQARESIVLHEIAHHIHTERALRSPSPEGSAHGPWFAFLLADLIEKYMSPEAALILRVGYADLSVEAYAPEREMS